jgi:FkbM family methyltransferase
LDTRVWALVTKNQNINKNQPLVVIDVGANVGYYSVILGNLLRKDSKLLAFEPNPESFEALQNNIILNNLTESIQPLCFALGEVEDSFDLIIPINSGSSAASRMNLHPEESSTACKVVQLKLDDFLLKKYPNRKIDLIKVDVEGGEFGFIKGALTTISNHKPVLFLELLRKWAEPFGYHPEDVRLMLEELGYFCFGISPEMPKIQKITEDTLETNFLFVQRKNLNDIDKIRMQITSIQAF